MSKTSRLVQCMVDMLLDHARPLINTVNSEIFARVIFSQKFADTKFREFTTLTRKQNHHVDYHAQVANFVASQTCLFNVICKNKILSKISKFTVTEHRKIKHFVVRLVCIMRDTMSAHKQL